MDFDFGIDCKDLKEWMENWKEEHNIPENAELTQEQTIEFVTELYSKMDELGYYDLPEDANIIPYSRTAIDGTAAWKIAEGIFRNSSNLYYISDSTAGKLINSNAFKKCLREGSEDEGVIYNLTIKTGDCSIDGLIPLESTRQDVVGKYGEPLEISERTGAYCYGTIDHDAGLGPAKNKVLQ